MSKRRAAFDESATNVTILPDPPAPSFPVRTGEDRSQPSRLLTPEPPEDRRDVGAPESSQPTRKPSRKPDAKRTRYRYPDADIAPELAQRVRELAIAERAADPLTCRSHGMIVLQAIEAHADQIQDAFKPATPAGAGGLFSYTDSSAARQRRRHGRIKPVKIVLSGVMKSDARKLDELVKIWGTGNRSALVETALRFYFSELDSKDS